MRPPLFPLIVAALGDNHTLLIVLNSIFGALLAPMTMLLAKQLKLSSTIITLAGLFVAVDPVTVHYTAFLGPEAISFVGALGMMNALVALVNSEKMSRAAGWGIVAALCLLFSAYTRPSIYLIWTGMSVWVLTQGLRRYWLAVVLYVVISFGGIEIWQQHNQQQFGHHTFSTVGSYTMTYYRAASVLRFGEDLTPDGAYLEINQRIKTILGEDPTTATPRDQDNYLASTPDIEAAFNTINMDIFTDYPLIYLGTLVIGTIRFFDLAPAVPPIENLYNPVLYVIPLWNIALLGGALIGAYYGIRNKAWQFLAVVILFGGYFTAGTLLVKSAGMTGRERTVLFPMIALAAAYGFYYLYKTYRERETADITPTSSA
ncbi:MAG: hypothetical protein AAFN11_21075, partial [Chloroflexota bacterium]